MDANQKKCSQLGLSFGTACNRLRKLITFSLAQQAKKDICFRCKKRIKLVEEFSVEHKSPWLDSENPVQLFFDLSNIAFSHLSCNAGAARNPRKLPLNERLKRQRSRNRLWWKKNYTTACRRKKKRETGW